VFSILNHPGLNHRPELITGVMEEECRAILQEFFRGRRASLPDNPEKASAAPRGNGDIDEV
jgi:tRNA(adenine34) deaminase